MFRPKPLQKGDKVAIAAPASPFDPKEFLIGVKKLEELGYSVVFQKTIFSRKDYLAGTDERRADELNRFFNDDSVNAIFFARGGYGTQKILPLLDADPLKTSPKVILGYSDLTALHLWLQSHKIGGAFYGPTIAKHFKSPHKETLKSLTDMIEGKTDGHLKTSGAKVLKKGTAEGILTGGCLSLVVSSIGTPYDLAIEDAILFLEDVFEPVYKYDRMLTQLKASGKLRNVKGIIFGSMSLTKGEKELVFKKMVKETLKDFPGPIVTKFPTGHLDLKKLFITLPLGVKVRITTDPVSLTLLESPFAI